MKQIQIILAFLMLAGCRTDRGARLISVGSDGCSYCQMTIVDERFTAQLITGKGKYLLFDDIHCMNEYANQPAFNGTEISGIYLADFLTPGNYLHPEDGYFLQGDNLRSPMGGNTAFFSSVQEMKETRSVLGGKTVSFESVFRYNP